ncbi:MAG TPA: PAS domain-containing protein, partial [Chitinophagaceae bacterium]|nr:PAS domain-containing protein [Chitinophagaceae bacterium]
MKPELHIADLNFKLLPDYAAYILNNHLEAYNKFLLTKSRELKVPLLNVFQSWPEEQLLSLGLETNKELLTFLAQNNARGQLLQNALMFQNNQLPQVGQEDIKAEDITLITYVRKQGLLHFIKEYTNDLNEVLELIKEIDLYSLESETISTNIYMNLLKDRINEHAHLIEKINNTIPGAVYVFDVANTKGIYSNNKLGSIIGYTQDELNILGDNALAKLLHPDDQQETLKNLTLIRGAEDGAISTYKYRIRNKKGEYKWVRNYESIFRRDEQKNVIETIGITLDIDKEQHLANELQEREAQLSEAQEIAQLGSFTWSFKDSKWVTSPQSIKILETDFNSLNSFLAKVHPADKERVHTSITNAINNTGLFECEYRSLG